MKSKAIIFLSLVFAIVIVFLITIDTSEDETLFSFELESQQGRESIDYWTDDNEDIYVFLPSYCDLSKLKLNLIADTDISINNIELSDEMSLGSFSVDTPYELRLSGTENTDTKTITFMKSQNVPTMYIDTMSGNMDHIHNDKKNDETGEVRLYTSTGEVDYSGFVRSISGRGNNTWASFEKKPYNIELSAPADLLDMGSANRWILLANAADMSNLRNKLVFDAAQKLNFSFVPEARWVDLYLNGEYSGLYLLCERNEVHPERVNLPAESSVLVSKELEDKLSLDGQTYVKTDNNQYLRVQYPEVVSSEDLQNISDLWASFENALLSPDGIDPISGRRWNEIIDVDSWARKFLIDEVFGNYDACLRSQFFYFDFSESEPVIHADLVWDYDHSMGSGLFWQTLNPNSFFANRYEVNDTQTAVWYYNLYNKEEFYNAVVDIYETEMKPFLSEDFNSLLSSYSENISSASKLNLLRWNGFDNALNYDVDHISSYMTERTAFLDKVYLENKQFYMAVVDASVGSNYAYYAVEPGGTIDCLPTLEGDASLIFDGWYYVDCDEPVDSNKPVNEDIRIYAKWINVNDNSDMMLLALSVGAMGILFLVFFVLDVKRNKRKREM